MARPGLKDEDLDISREPVAGVLRARVEAREKAVRRALARCITNVVL